MPRLHHELVRFQDLADPRRAALTAEITAVLGQVFDGIEHGHLDRFIGSFENVELLRTADGRLVGVNSFRFIDVTPPGARAPVSVLNHFAGILPEYRGGNVVLGALVREGFRHWFRRGLRPFVYCCRFIHPSPYRLMVRYGSQAYPTPEWHDDADRDALLGALGDALGYPVERNPAGLWVTRPAFAVRGEAPGAERHAQTDPATRFFLEQCPDFRRGQGLLVVMPLSFRAAVEIPARIGWARALRLLRRGTPQGAAGTAA